MLAASARASAMLARGVADLTDPNDVLALERAERAAAAAEDFGQSGGRSLRVPMKSELDRARGTLERLAGQAQGRPRRRGLAPWW